MKIHGLAIAVLVLLALGGFLYWSDHRKPGENSTKISADTPPQILKLDESSITKLDLKKKDAAPIQLAKSNSGEWQITQPKQLRADDTAVSGVLSTLSSLTSERLVEDKASDLKNFGLDHPSLEVDLGEKDNQSQKLLIGDDTPVGNGVYAMLAGDLRVFTVASYTKTSVDKTLNDLRDKRLLPLSPDKISRVELVKPGQSIEFGRNKDEWQILKPKPLRADSTQVGDLVRELTEAKMDLSASSDAASDFAHATPVVTAKLTDVSGTEELQIRKNPKDKQDTYYAKSSAVDGTYKIDASVGKAVDKTLDAFRSKKLFDFGFSDPNKIELHSGGKSYSLTRGTAGGEDWWSNGKKMDFATVEPVISKLRDLAANKFAESGFSTPTVDATIVSDDGKRTEKVLISKSGDHYIAKRENESALYQLDSASVDALLKAADDMNPAEQSAARKP
jgi:Domain of unknown function (DUF4340)